MDWSEIYLSLDFASLEMQISVNKLKTFYEQPIDKQEAHRPHRSSEID